MFTDLLKTITVTFCGIYNSLDIFLANDRTLFSKL